MSSAEAEHRIAEQQEKWGTLTEEQQNFLHEIRKAIKAGKAKEDENGNIFTTGCNLLEEGGLSLADRKRITGTIFLD